MGNFFDEIQDEQQKNLEALEQKAKEYEQVTAEIAKLKSTVQGLQDSICGLDKTLQSISPQDIDEFKKKSLTLFDPLQKTAEVVNTKIQAAGYEAAQTLKKAGEKREKSWTEYGLEALLTSCMYIALTSAVLWFMFGIGDIKKDVEYNRDRIDAIQWNQTTAHTEGNKTYNPWEMKEFHQAWDNQNAYVIKTMQEAAKQQQQSQK